MSSILLSILLHFKQYGYHYHCLFPANCYYSPAPHIECADSIAIFQDIILPCISDQFADVPARQYYVDTLDCDITLQIDEYFCLQEGLRPQNYELPGRSWLGSCRYRITAEARIFAVSPHLRRQRWNVPKTVVEDSDAVAVTP